MAYRSLASGDQQDTVSDGAVSSSQQWCTPIDDGSDARPTTDGVCPDPFTKEVQHMEDEEVNPKKGDNSEFDDDDDDDDYYDDDDVNDDDDDEEENGEDDESFDYSMALNTWGKPQTIYNDHQDSIQQLLNETRLYMKKFLGDETNVGRNKCRNYDIECSSWASGGECTDEDGREYSKISKQA
jgi:hypothetical protein